MSWLLVFHLFLGVGFQPTVSSFPGNTDNLSFLQKVVEAYVSWGSLPGKEHPNCSSFDELFTGNKTWISPFAVPNGLAEFDVAKTCNMLAQNLSWHSGSLTAGNYVYPFYNGSHEVEFAGFVWTAAGGASEFETFFGRQEYNFQILSVLQPEANGKAIYLAKDSFWPVGNGEPPAAVRTLVDQYASLVGGDCNKFPDLFGKENRYVAVSGNNHRFEGTAELVSFCNMVMSSWTEYVTQIDHVSYGVSTHDNEVNYIAFTWMRMGLYKGETRTLLLLTEMGVENEAPTQTLKISGAFDYFEV
jgi:hypothetical protein